MLRNLLSEKKAKEALVNTIMFFINSVSSSYIMAILKCIYRQSREIRVKFFSFLNYLFNSFFCIIDTFTINFLSMRTNQRACNEVTEHWAKIYSKWVTYCFQHCRQKN